MTTNSLISKLAYCGHDGYYNELYANVVVEIKDKLSVLDKIISRYKNDKRLNMLYESGMLSLFETDIMDIICELDKKYEE